MPQPRRRGTPTPLLLLYLLIRLAVPPSVAQAQYLQPKDGSIRRHERDFSPWPDRLFRREDGDQATTSTSKDLYLLAFDDMCLFGPSDPFARVSESQGNVVAWCTKDGRNGRLIPDGTLHGVTYVKTPNYRQVSGFGDFTKINIAPGDWGGQFDSKDHKPDGAKLFTSDSDMAENWVLIISATTYCLRACTGDARFCPTTYDAMGCYFYTGNAIGPDWQWQNCESDDGDPPGIVDGSTYTQGASPTPSQTAPALSSCQSGNSVSNGQTMPPYYDWRGTGVAEPATVAPSNQGGGQQSISWVPVHTCTPCGGGDEPTSHDSGPPTSSATVGNTENQGVTQVQSHPPPQASTGSGGAALVKEPPEDLELHRRQDDVTTSGDQCCFTTWTSTIVGAGQQTSAGVAEGSAGSAVATGVSGAHASSASGGVLLTGGLSASGSVRPTGSISGSVRPSGSLTAGNSTNSTEEGGGNGSAMGLRTQIVGVQGYGRIALSIGAGLGLVSLLGGALLV